MHAVNENDPDRRIQLCEWFQHKRGENEGVVRKIVWPDEAQFKLNEGMNTYNCVYWSSEKTCVQVDKAVNLPGISIWCGVSRDIAGSFFFF